MRYFGDTEKMLSLVLIFKTNFIISHSSDIQSTKQANEFLCDMSLDWKP